MTNFLFPVATIVVLLVLLSVILLRSIRSGRTNAPRRRRQPAALSENLPASYDDASGFCGNNDAVGESGGSTDSAGGGGDAGDSGASGD